MTKRFLRHALLAASVLVVSQTASNAGTLFIVTQQPIGIMATSTHDELLILRMIFDEEGKKAGLAARDALPDDQLIFLKPGTRVYLEHVYKDGTALIRVEGSATLWWTYSSNFPL
jgi:hypothetical protein